MGHAVKPITPAPSPTRTPIGIARMAKVIIGMAIGGRDDTAVLFVTPYRREEATRSFHVFDVLLTKCFNHLLLFNSYPKWESQQEQHSEEDENQICSDQRQSKSE
jgi:hypothetical protein